MSCYFGCATGANKCAWLWWFLLVAAGAGCLAGWSVSAKGCIGQAEICFKENGVNGDGLVFNPAFFKELWGTTNVTDVCENFFPSNSSELAGCITCFGEAAPCFEPSLATFIAGAALACASFVACMFMCCCSSHNADKDSKSRYGLPTVATVRTAKATSS